MRQRLTSLALAAATMAGCAHAQPRRTTPSETAVITGSRLARRGSPRSHGVQVIGLERIHQTGEVILPRALKKIAVAFQ